MKSRKMTYLMVLTILVAVVMPSIALADSVDEIKNKEAEVKKQGETINAEIDSVVAAINAKYQDLAKLDSKISDSQKEIEQTETDIVATQESIEKRSGVVAERMKDMQLRGVGQNSLQALLEAESFSDFLNRAYAVTVLQNAENSKIESLYEDKEKLSQLEAKLIETQTNLETQQQTAETEKVSLDTEVASLKEKLASNASTLDSLTAERVSKENAIREAAAAKAAEEARIKEEAAKQPVQTVNSTNNSGTTESSTNNSANNNSGGGQITPPIVPPTTLPPVTPPTTGGISGQATAYIATGNNTATGTVPTVGRTIAVDPNKIPLGSRVQIEVPSMPQYSGVYIAEDTGGAVNGYIIDMFVGSLNEAKQFGRRSIIITVL
ncbi:3D domain-containing protein [uncultured Vagococcus sp.]|uniref:coiled-coil domain-containing protein n=1 Tax=uncultured Vagococcus sp. TaxID=189676 RepID=UPI0028D04E5B|nr:3D domain-containing protein [uncultured Vagococcus sp.]